MEPQGLNVWIPAITGIIGAFVGSVSSFIPNLILDTYKRRRESELLEAALVAEVEALLDIVESRNYEKSFQDIISHLSTQSPETTYSLSIRVPDHYSRIYQGNALRLGIVCSNVAVNIIKFHQLVDSVIQDVTSGGVLSTGARLHSYKETYEILQRALSLGRKIAGTR